jgi:hypothetical protein
MEGGRNGVETITVNQLGNYVYAIAVNKYSDPTNGVAPGENNVEEDNLDNNSPTSSTSSIPNIPLYQSQAKVSVYAPGYLDPILEVTIPNFLSTASVMSSASSVAIIKSNEDNFDWWLPICFDGSLGINSMRAMNKLTNTKPKYTDCVDYLKSNP